MGNEHLRKAWAEIIAAEDYETHMAAIGQAEANAQLMKDLFDRHPWAPTARLLFAGAGTGQMFDYVSPDFLLTHHTIFTDINPGFLNKLRSRIEGTPLLRFETLVDDIEDTQVQDTYAVAMVLVLEHVDWRKALSRLIELGFLHFYLIIQVNPAEQPDAVSPTRVLPGTMQNVSKDAKPELVDQEELHGFFEGRRFERVVLESREVADGKKMLGLVYRRTYVKPEESDPVQRELQERVLRLSSRGQERTETELRKIYANGNNSTRHDAAQFLLNWNSSRAVAVAKDWLDEKPPAPLFSRLLLACSRMRNQESLEFHRALLKRSDLTDEELDTVLDSFSFPAQFTRGQRGRDAMDEIATYLDHPCPEVRWTALFHLAGDTRFREKIQSKTFDTVLCRYGFVSGLAKQVLRMQNGEDVDLHDARFP